MLLHRLIPVIKNSELLSTNVEWFAAGSVLSSSEDVVGFLFNLSQYLGFLLHANEEKLFCSCHIISKKLIKDYKGNLHQHLFSLQ